MHFASVLVYGDFILADGTHIRCEGIPGISGVTTLPVVETLKMGQMQVKLERIATHFNFLDGRTVMIEQHSSRRNDGTLTSAGNGRSASLLYAIANALDGTG
ncbi:MAG: hypothetical protein O7I42_20565 [Alphaproteobacteria bacterium]|nr:hypothetical protein [Alphaproteobacteria bacterium]